MNTHPDHRSVPDFLSAALATFLLTAFAVALPAQTVAPAPAASSAPSAAASAKDEPVVLSPFEVNSGDDKGYAASSALAGTRTNEKLANLPNSISVFTADLMSDLALNDFYA